MVYTLQVVNMLSDLVLLAALVYALSAPVSIVLKIFAVVCVWYGSKSTGGLFFSWKRKNIRQFFINMRNYYGG